MVNAICPHCKKQVNALSFEELEAQRPEGTDENVFPAVAYVCPHCHFILGVGIDPRTLGVRL